MFLPFLNDSVDEGGVLKLVKGFGTDLLRGKLGGVPLGLGRRLRVFVGLSGGVLRGIRLAIGPPDPVFGDPSPCWVFSSTPLSMSVSVWEKKYEI